ncbi:MAG: pectin acetylesterase-family hydrolase [Bdellovibrionota bacterium]
MQSNFFIFIVLVSLFFPRHTEARMFESIDIPGASCGRGDAYFVMVDLRNLKKFAFFFEGGGACWDLLTCATQVTTQLDQPKDYSFNDAIFSDDPSISPLSDYSIVYFPYCTGDLFAGSFNTNYQGIFEVQHQGRHNFLLGLQSVLTIYGSLIRHAKEAVYYGYSAGALGLMLNFTDLDQLVGQYIPRKTVLLDGMGLHWDEGVWARFQAPLLESIKEGFGRMNVVFDPNEWPLAKKAIEVCHKYPEYEFGLLQGSMDLVMGSIFGFMSPLTHRRRVYGDQGIYQSLIDPRDNCAAFVPDTFKHTFLEKDGSMGLLTRTRSGVTAYQFVQELLKIGAGASYR